MKQPKYRKHSTRNKAFVVIEGKRVYLPGEYDSPESRSAYTKLISRPELEIRRAKPLTIASLIVQYLDHVQVELSPGTYKIYKRGMSLLLTHCPGMLIEEFGPLRFKAFRKKLAEEGYARNSVKSICSSVKAMFRWAASNELIPASLSHALSAVEPMRLGTVTEKEPIKPIQWKYVRATIRACSNPVLADMLRIQWLVGCRSSEVCNMRWADIQKAPDLWTWTPSRHKSAWRGSTLTYHLGPICQRILARWDEKSIDGYVFSLATIKPSRVHSTKTMSSCDYGKTLKRVIERANKDREKLKQELIPHWHPHQMRHSRATRMRSLYGIETARVALGMKSLATAQIYAEQDIRRAKRARSRL